MTQERLSTPRRSEAALRIAKEVLEAEMQAALRGLCHPPLEWSKVVELARYVDSVALSESTPIKPDPVAELCTHIKESIRLCGHGYIHITCGDCQRRD